MTHLFFSLTLGLYSCSTAAYLACLLRTTPVLTLWASRLLSAGCITHVLSTVHLASTEKHLPLTNMQESLSFFSLMIIAVFLLFERRYKVTTLGSFVTPVALVMFGVSSTLHGEVR